MGGEVLVCNCQPVSEEDQYARITDCFFGISRREEKLEGQPLRVKTAGRHNAMEETSFREVCEVPGKVVWKARPRNLATPCFTEAVSETELSKDAQRKRTGWNTTRRAKEFVAKRPTIPKVVSGAELIGSVGFLTHDDFGKLYVYRCDRDFALVCFGDLKKYFELLDSIAMKQVAVRFVFINGKKFFISSNKLSKSLKYLSKTQRFWTSLRVAGRWQQRRTTPLRQSSLGQKCCCDNRGHGR